MKEGILTTLSARSVNEEGLIARLKLSGTRQRRPCWDLSDLLGVSASEYVEERRMCLLASHGAVVRIISGSNLAPCGSVQFTRRLERRYPLHVEYDTEEGDSTLLRNVCLLEYMGHTRRWHSEPLRASYLARVSTRVLTPFKLMS